MVKLGQDDIAKTIKDGVKELQAQRKYRQEDKRQTARQEHTNGSTPRSTQ